MVYAYPMSAACTIPISAETIYANGSERPQAPANDNCHLFLLTNTPLIPALSGNPVQTIMCEQGSLSIRWIPGQARYERKGKLGRLTSSSGPWGSGSYSYDADSDLKKMLLRYAKPSLGVLGGFSYRYDQDGSGKMTAAYSTGSSWRYTPSAKTQTYAGTNALDQYGSVNLGDGAGARVQSYDGAGNLTNDGNGRTYTYNSENQMVRAQGPGLDMEYWYDALGRRSHSIDHVANTEVFHKHYGQMEVGDYTVTREGGQIGVGKALTYTPTFRIILGAGIDERIAYHDVNGDDLSFYLTNHQGSTIAMTNEDGTLKPLGSGGRYVYDPHGNDTKNASQSGNPYRYTGRRLDAQTGLYYYRARYYDPKQGKFLQTDPIGYADQMNLYNYVGNDPVNGIDPFGLEEYSYAGKDEDDKSAENAFKDRADATGTDGSTQWANGEELIQKFKDSPNIENANIFSHGAENGLIGEDGTDTGNEGFYVIPSNQHSRDAAYATDFASAVKDGDIDLLQNATITLFACDSDHLAEVLSSNLGFVGRSDVTVIGAQGNVTPIMNNGREVGAMTGQPYQKFRSYKNGKIVSSTRKIRW